MIAAGSEIIVKRTSGQLEGGWFMGTDLSRTDGSASAYTAPENVGCMVFKPVDGATRDEVLAGEALCSQKFVSLTDLMSWNHSEAA